MTACASRETRRKMCTKPSVFTGSHRNNAKTAAKLPPCRRSEVDELVIKVPAPFTGVEDLGFSARYPAQPAGERLRDVPFFVEGPPRPMQLLVERLALFAEKDQLLGDAAEDDASSWTAPV